MEIDHGGAAMAIRYRYDNALCSLFIIISMKTKETKI